MGTFPKLLHFKLTVSSVSDIYLKPSKVILAPGVVTNIFLLCYIGRQKKSCLLIKLQCNGQKFQKNIICTMIRYKYLSVKWH